MVNPDDWQRLDWRLLQNGGVALYFRPAVLEQDLEWLQANHYDLYQFQCKSWHSPEILHQDFKRALQFPDYYGQNFAALDECLGDLPVPEDGGAAIVLQSFDAYAKGLPTITRRQSSQTDAEVLLDILASASRTHLLYGKRFLTLIQSDDPRIRFERLGCIRATWNPKEWLDKNRGL